MMKSATRWDNFNEAWSYYQKYIENKTNSDSLTVKDLIFISNFKGGNASITEPASRLEEKLKAYEAIQSEIRDSFSGKTLAELKAEELESLVSMCDRYIRLATQTETKIRGLGPSYASALLSAHFPELVPILDRRVLNASGIKASHYKNGQVKKIEQYYTELIRYFHGRMKGNASLKSLRELDRVLFVGEN